MGCDTRSQHIGESRQHIIVYTAELTLTHVEVEAVLKASSSEIPAAVVHRTVQCSDSRSTAAFVWFLSKLSLLSALLERVQSIAHRAANHMQYESGKVLIFLSSIFSRCILWRTVSKFRDCVLSRGSGAAADNRPTMMCDDLFEGILALSETVMMMMMMFLRFEAPLTRVRS